MRGEAILVVMDAQRLAALAERAEADLIEIFSSIQGEGPRVGERHLFVRTAHCDLNCVWCDTPLCHQVPRSARVTTCAGGATTNVANPVPVQQIVRWIDEALRNVPHAAVAFTGGEPLLHPWLLIEAAATVREHGVAVLLETDGALPHVPREVRHCVDIVSMDWKLPSSTGERNLDQEHIEFLRVARGGEVVVKLVVTDNTTEIECAHVAAAVAANCPEATLVLQPVTPLGGVRPPQARTMLRLQDAALPIHKLTRVLPQVHRLMGQP